MVGPSRGVGAGSAEALRLLALYFAKKTSIDIHTHFSRHFTANGPWCGVCMAILCAHVARSHVKASSRASC